MRGNEIMAFLVSPLVFATAVAIPSAQAQEGSDSPPKTAAVPQSLRAPAQHNCSAWLPVDAELLAGVCIGHASGDRYAVTASVLNHSATQHTVAVFVYVRVGRTWATGTNYWRAQCGLSVDRRKTVQCTSPWRSIRATNQWKWGVARVVHTDAHTQRTVWNPTGIR
jgi:hypothetical protein